MRAYRCRLRLLLSAYRTNELACSSLLPTLTRSTFGSNKGGSKGREGKERFSLQSLAKMGQLKPLKGVDPVLNGYLANEWTEVFMGFPSGWTQLVDAKPPSATPSFLHAVK